MEPLPKERIAVSREKERVSMDTEITEEQISELLTEQGFSAPASIERLGGLTNKSFRAVSDTYDVVVRFPGDGTEELVNRGDEKIINEEASRIGVDTRLYYFDGQTGRKISAYVPFAETLHANTACESENIQLIGKLFAKLHAEAQPVDVIFDPIEKVDDYERLIYADGGTLWDDYQDTKARVMNVFANLPEQPRAFCHCDPLCENFVKDPQSKRLYLVDWEYSGMCDPLWDLADIAIEAGYSDDQMLELARAYFDREPETSEMERMYANIVLIDFLWSLWGEQRSAYDKSLIGYGDARYARAKENLEKLAK